MQRCWEPGGQITLGRDSLGLGAAAPPRQFSSCTSLCPGEVEPCGEETSPPLSEMLPNSLGKTGERPLAVLDPLSTAGVLMPVPGWGAVTRGKLPQKGLPAKSLR